MNNYQVVDMLETDMLKSESYLMNKAARNYLLYLYV